MAEKLSVVGARPIIEYMHEQEHAQAQVYRRARTQSSCLRQLWQRK